ncbi:MAG: NifU family protein [Solirubrobacterales bacterium]|nr:NifU family protein [Solirubrobacterales bacterium]
MHDEAAREAVGRVEALLEQVEQLPDRVGRETAAELTAALVELYGEGLTRIMDALVVNGETSEVRRALGSDELVSHLLLLHDLHPIPVEERVRDALGEVRPYLESHGGDVELLAVEAGVVKLRLQGSCSGCPSSTMTLKLAIEDAIAKLAPEIESVEAEGVVAEPAAPALIQLEVNKSTAASNPVAAASGPAAESWEMAGSLTELAGGGTVVRPVRGEELLFVRVEDDRYAYRPACPGCGASLESATLRGAELSCSGCGHRYDVRRAGRCLDAPELYLAPLPLLLDDSGLVKVALGSAGAPA